MLFRSLIFVTFLWLELQDYPEWPSLATGRRFRHLLSGHILRIRFLLQGLLRASRRIFRSDTGFRRQAKGGLCGAWQRGVPGRPQAAASAPGLCTLFEPILQISRPFEQPQSSELAELLRPLTVVRFLLRKNPEERYARRLRRQRVINIIPDV